MSEYPSLWIEDLCAELEDAEDKDTAFKAVLDKVLLDKRRSYDVIDCLYACGLAEGVDVSYLDATLDRAAHHLRRRENL